MTFDITIDGKRARAAEGLSVLDVAREAGADIPTLCFLEGLPGYGACRLCMVEVAPPSGSNGRAKIVASCAHPASPGLDVRTKTREVDLVRRMVMDLLLARCPDSDEVRRMASRLGVERSSYAPDSRADKCVLCGTCVRVCAQVGPRAISSAGRGPSREVVTPFREPSSACVGCLSCAKACPTANIAYEADDGRVRIWGREFEKVACPKCGRLGGTREQVAYYAKRYGWDEATMALCDACKRAETAKTFFGLMKL